MVARCRDSALAVPPLALLDKLCIPLSACLPALCELASCACACAVVSSDLARLKALSHMLSRMHSPSHEQRNRTCNALALSHERARHPDSQTRVQTSKQARRASNLERPNGDSTLPVPSPVYPDAVDGLCLSSKLPVAEVLAAAAPVEPDEIVFDLW